MNDIEVLCRLYFPMEQRMTIASNIIIQYDLRFSVEDIIKVFEYIGKAGLWNPSSLLHLLLTTNLRMFIAVAYAILDDNTKLHQSVAFHAHCYGFLMVWNEQGWGYGHGHLKLGCTEDLHNIAEKIYCALYDYYEFDITNLELSEKSRKLIQNHIDSKVSNVKRAVKQSPHCGTL